MRKIKDEFIDYLKRISNFGYTADVMWSEFIDLLYAFFIDSTSYDVVTNTDQVGVFIQVDPCPLSDIEWKFVFKSLVGRGINYVGFCEPSNNATKRCQQHGFTLFFHITRKDYFFFIGKCFEAGMTDPEVSIITFPIEYPFDEFGKVVTKNDSCRNDKRTAKVKLSLCLPLTYSQLVEDVNRRKQAKRRYK